MAAASAAPLALIDRQASFVAGLLPFGSWSLARCRGARTTAMTARNRAVVSRLTAARSRSRREVGSAGPGPSATMTAPATMAALSCFVVAVVVVHLSQGRRKLFHPCDGHGVGGGGPYFHGMLLQVLSDFSDFLLKVRPHFLELLLLQLLASCGKAHVIVKHCCHPLQSCLLLLQGAVCFFPRLRRVGLDWCSSFSPWSRRLPLIARGVRLFLVVGVLAVARILALSRCSLGRGHSQV